MEMSSWLTRPPVRKKKRKSANSNSNSNNNNFARELESDRLIYPT